MLLRAGAISVDFRDGELWHVYAGGTEIAERIYVAVRDREWGTVPARLENLKVTESEVRFDAVHQAGEIRFRWHGAIELSASGRLRFAMDGRAESAFHRNRIGICLHHPLLECRGKEATVETAGGMRHASRFPGAISPHQVFVNMRALSYEFQPGARVRFAFQGDIFETEDQRNWTDANFKTYSTPLALPFPVEVKEGTLVRQDVEISVSGEIRGTREESSGDVQLDIEDRAGARLPAIGFTLGRTPLAGPVLAAIRKLRPAHLRVSGADFHHGLAAAEELPCKLEVALVAGDPLPGASAHVERVLLFDQARANQVSGVARFMGSDGHFAELNRNRPHAAGCDGLCFPASPQVHAFDDESVMANTAGQFETVASAHGFAGGKPVAVTPILLRPRPQPADPRQRTAFCAAWTVASLAHLSRAGAAAATYFETHGPGGVCDESGPFPVYRIFELLAGAPRAEILAVRSSHPRRVAGLAFATPGGGKRLIIANLVGSSTSVRTSWRKEPLLLPAYGVEFLDQ